MKLKFPKTIQINDITFKVITDPEWEGASLTYWDKDKKGNATLGNIKIGTYLLKTNPFSVLSLIIHELKEIIQIEQGTRYHKPSDESYEFHYNHKEHQAMCSQLGGLLKEFIK